MTRILGGWTLEITLESLDMARVSLPGLVGLLLPMLLCFVFMKVMAGLGERISREKEGFGIFVYMFSLFVRYFLGEGFI